MSLDLVEHACHLSVWIQNLYFLVLGAFSLLETVCFAIFFFQNATDWFDVETAFVLAFTKISSWVIHVQKPFFVAPMCCKRDQKSQLPPYMVWEGLLPIQSSRTRNRKAIM
jgi:hypothetical protein